ncbi:MAG: phytanoyl-CoA dioxygenase family protein [Bacteroidota bacterium]|nr:phytanoyl-CoA dioxygenase family protein [Bacteroidota bacterium]
MKYKKLTQQDKKTFDRDGYLLVSSMFSPKETTLLYNTAIKDEMIRNKSYDRGDKEGLRTKLALWYSLDDSIYSLAARSERIVSGVELLLEGEPAHFHSKLMQKEPRVGGAWEWHQDYGYWYRDGFLFPNMLSVLTSLTVADKENGCLQVIKGSQKLGRIEHGVAGEQVGANQERVDEILKIMDLVYVEMNPGDTLFFHSNLLHRSDRNNSSMPRWSLISAYNRKDNKPYKEANKSSCATIAKVPDSAILEYGGSSISEEADFLIKAPHAER